MNPKRKQRLILILAGVILVAVATALILFANSKNISWFKHPAEIAAGDFVPDQMVRVGGLVKGGSLKQASEDGLDVTFLITDCAVEIPVTYDKILPDLFREGQSVVVEGRVVDGVIIASQVLAKHDEQYMPPEADAAIKSAQASGATCDATSYNPAE
jgi:cytochrome c-type biogenesis protein CcmE